MVSFDGRCQNGIQLGDKISYLQVSDLPLHDGELVSGVCAMKTDQEN